MSLHGRRQLAEWSIDHSCFSAAERTQATLTFSRRLGAFCEGIVEQFGGHAQLLPELKLRASDF